MTDYEKAIVAHQKQLCAYARYLTHDTYLAEELLQDTLLRLLSKADKYEERQKFGKWATQVMHNNFLNACRSNNTSRTRSLITGYNDAVDEPTLSVADSDSSCNYTEIITIIQNLPPTAARLLSLRAVGYKYDEIATELGIPIGTVKTRLFAAREMLRKRLEM